MNFQTQAGAAASILVMHRHEAFAPPVRQNGRFLTDPVRVITKGLKKGLAFTNGTVNQIVIRRVAQRENIGFD